MKAIGIGRGVSLVARIRPGVSPDTIANLVAWWDAGANTFKDLAETQPATADGDLVLSWRDKIGGYKWTVVTAGVTLKTQANGINNLPTIYSTGRRLRSTFEINGAKTVVVVGRLVSLPAAGAYMAVVGFWKTAALVSSEFGIANAIPGYTDELWTSDHPDAGGTSVGVPNVADLNPHAWLATYNNGGYNLPASYTENRDGTAGVVQACGAFAGSTESSLFQRSNESQAADVKVSEILVYSRALSALERTNLMSYLTSKYGL